MEERAVEPPRSVLPPPLPSASTKVRARSDAPDAMATAKVSTMTELLAEKTPQTTWWMQRTDDGKPVQWPLLLAAAPMLAVLSVPAFGAMLLLLPAMVPVLALAPLVVLASLPWWLNLPMNGKPLIIPLVLAAIPLIIPLVLA